MEIEQEQDNTYRTCVEIQFKGIHSTAADLDSGPWPIPTYGTLSKFAVSAYSKTQFMCASQFQKALYMIHNFVDKKMMF